MEQFQKVRHALRTCHWPVLILKQAIKKVRAVQRMRRNRGFAFSQTEEGQEQLIRSCKASLSLDRYKQADETAAQTTQHKQS